MDIISKIINNASNNPLDIISIIVAILAGLYIPRRIMIDQLYADLVSKYRESEMGGAILSVFHFYSSDCENNPNLITEKYIERYKKEIGNPMKLCKDIDFSKTLQFQRRLIAYFYWDLAKLRFNYKIIRLSKRQLGHMIQVNERNLISLVLQMAEANAMCFEKCDNIAEPPDDDVKMNRFIKKLYDETEE